MITAEKKHYNSTKNLLRTAVAAAAISIPLIHTSTSDAAGFARRGGFRPAPAFHGNFHPQFRQNFHPQPRENFHPQFRENFHPQPRENFHPQFRQNFHPQFRENFHPPFRQNFHPQFRENFHDRFRLFDRFDRGFRYGYDRDWCDRIQPGFGLNFNYGYNVYQPYLYSYPAYNYQPYVYTSPSYPVYNYQPYVYTSPTYPVQTYPQVYIPQAQTYVAADPPAVQTSVPYQSQSPPAYIPQTAPDPIILTYPNLQVITPGRKTTLADVENM